MFDSNGNFLFTFGEEGTLPGQFMFPNRVAIDAAGRIFVADGGNDRIQVFDPDGAYLRAIGSSGALVGQFNFVTDIEFDDAGRLYAVDHDNALVQVFDPTGEFLFVFSHELDEPIGLDVDAKAGLVYVADAGADEIKVFDLITNADDNDNGVADCLEFCRGDCAPGGGDGQVDIDDMMHIIINFGSTGTPCDIAPDNQDGTFGDGVIDIDDLNAVLAEFGPCPGSR